eukprot:Sdes_comp20183_c0_seq1m13445
MENNQAKYSKLPSLNTLREVPSPNLLKEPLFGYRYDKFFRHGTRLVTGAAGVYIILFADFGENEHCFSPIRRLFHSSVDEFLSLSPSEEKKFYDNFLDKNPKDTSL